MRNLRGIQLIRYFPKRSMSVLPTTKPEAVKRITKYDYYKKLPAPQYGGRHIVTLIPGGGVGPELLGLVQEMFDFISAPVDFEVVEVGENVEDVKYAIKTVLRNKCAIKGIMGRFEGVIEDDIVYSSPNLALRRKLDLYACVNHMRSFKGVKCKYDDLDIILIRQNTEGEFTMLEHEGGKGIVECMKVITAYESERVARFAFEYARKHKRKKVSIIHKANIMKLSDGQFLKTSREVGEEYPEIITEDLIVDNTCMQLVSWPYQFDIILTPNLYGTIICNLVSGLMGSGGLVSGGNFNENYAMFECGTRNPAEGIKEHSRVFNVTFTFNSVSSD